MRAGPSIETDQPHIILRHPQRASLVQGQGSDPARERDEVEGGPEAGHCAQDEAVETRAHRAELEGPYLRADPHDAAGVLVEGGHHPRVARRLVSVRAVELEPLDTVAVRTHPIDAAGGPDP